MDVNRIETEKCQPARQHMQIVIRSRRSLANKLHILARQVDIFGINQFTTRKHILIGNLLQFPLIFTTR